MKYWRGYLAAAIFAAISWGLVSFAKAHDVLVDMVYPYMTRTLITSLSQWSGGVQYCVWNMIVLLLIVAAIVSVIMMIVLRWNAVQYLGWMLAVVSFFGMLHTVLYGLNQYTSPLAEDVRLDVTDYTVTELTEATTYFRDQANPYAAEVSRDHGGHVKFSNFKTLAKQAGEGFRTLTYDQTISVFAGSTVPVKSRSGGKAYSLYPLTGEVTVNEDLEDIALPFVMCTGMSRRMCISDEEDARFAAFMACRENSSAEFQYSAYCIAYYYCYNALSSIPTSTARDAAAQIHAGADPLLLDDLADCEKALGLPNEDAETDTADLLTSWYIQTFITPLHKEEEKPFNPLDPSQVDLTYTTPELQDFKKDD